MPGSPVLVDTDFCRWYYFYVRNLTAGQLERISEISGNIAVAWFTAGVISPLIVHPQNLLASLITSAISLALAGIFFFISLDFAEEVRT